MRVCEHDFGAKIDINVASIRKDKTTALSRAHCAVGKISYSNGSIGYLIYLKSSITGDEDIGIQQYRSSHADFPHESTGDQFFAEDQFESYRRLGHHITTLAFRGVETKRDLVEMAPTLHKLWVPDDSRTEAFVAQAEALDTLWERFRMSPNLRLLLQELYSDGAPALPKPGSEERCACLELIQLMENVFLALRLDESWEHPDNRGWATLFMMWAKSPTLRSVWEQTHQTYGIRHGRRARL